MRSRTLPYAAGTLHGTNARSVWRSKRGGTWLDCACGSGYGAELIASTADHVLALDSDLHAIRYARKHHARPNVRYLAVPIVEAMFHAFRVGGLTAILSIETLEHLPLQEQRAWVATAASLLGTDGTFVVCCPVRTTAGGGSANPWHVYEPTEAELGDMLGTHFGTHEITTEPYESTSGPAVQAWAVARTPRVPR